MATIYAYRKVIEGGNAVEMLLPDSEGDEGEIYCAELGEVDGVTYVSVPDGVALPAQPMQVDVVEMTPELAAAIKAVSPLVALMNERCEAAVRARYSAEDEAAFARITDPGAASAAEQRALQEYLAFIETVADSKRSQLTWWGLPASDFSPPDA